MKTINYKGHKVEIYSGFDGDQIFIENNNEVVYSARVNKGEGEARMHRVLD